MSSSVIDDTDILAGMRLLTRDLRKMVGDMQPESIRSMVDLYYQTQEMRKALGNQVRAAQANGDPALFLSWAFTKMQEFEATVRSALGILADNTVPGRWCLAVHGVGGVLAAGMLAHIDITKTPTASALWSFAGYNPAVTWERGQKRPWNATLKTLCWRLGDSFVKTSNSDKAYYGKVYRQAKLQEVARNQQGAFAETAAETLQGRKNLTAPMKEAYMAGLLPDGRIDLRARRKAIKLFLAHLFTVLYEHHYHTPAPRPYILAQDDPRHTAYLPPPNWPMEEDA